MRRARQKSTTPAPRRARAVTDLRFPCGHLEPEQAAERRMRLRDRAVWVACRRCNVIAVTVCAA
jgi:hypothetical protein